MSARSLRTAAVQAGIAAGHDQGAVVPPLHLSTNFVFDAPGVCGRYDYTRSGNPTRDLLADALAELEAGEGAVITSSGMAAVALCTHLLGPGDLLLAPHDLYGGCHRLFVAESRRVGFEVRFVDQSRPGGLDAVRHLRPRMVWLETPSNPFLRITDVAAWTAWAREVGALSVVDNTFLSPALQQPLTLGADVVVHSTTKFVNGHSDVVGGAVVWADPDVGEEMRWWANCLGVTGAPFDAYLTLRGLRTLHARVRLHEENARAVVDFLAAHPAVARVHYPGLRSHAGHDVAARQQRGWGSLVSLELEGGRRTVDAFLSGLEVFTLAESLGGVESLVAHPATMTHASMTPEAQAVAGIHGGLLRLSVGIEGTEDLVQDLARGLERAADEVGDGARESRREASCPAS